MKVKTFEVLSPIAPTIEIEKQLLDKIRMLVAVCPKECQWYHRVIRTSDKNNNYTYKLVDMFIPEQTSGAADVESSPEEMTKFWQEYQQEQGLDLPELGKIMSETTCWCHSHVKMGVNPSGTDIGTWTEQLNAGSSNPQIMMIFNKHDEVYSRLYEPEHDYEFLNVPIKIIDPEALTLKAEMEHIVKNRIKNHVYVPRTIFHGSPSYNGGFMDWKKHQLANKDYETWPSFSSTKNSKTSSKYNENSDWNDWSFDIDPSQQLDEATELSLAFEITTGEWELFEKLMRENQSTRITFYRLITSYQKYSHFSTMVSDINNPSNTAIKHTIEKLIKKNVLPSTIISAYLAADAIGDARITGRPGDVNHIVTALNKLTEENMEQSYES